MLFPRIVSAVWLGVALSGAAASAGQDSPSPAPLRAILGRDAEGWREYLDAHENPAQRCLALFCLGEFGPRASAAAPSVQKALRDPFSDKVRRLAVETLGLIGPEAKAALPDLLALLTSQPEPWPVRRAACEALARIAPGDPDVARAAIRALDCENPGVRLTAVDAVASAALAGSAKARDALRAPLLEAEESEAAARALRCLDPRDPQPFLDALRKSEAPAARLVCVRALAKMAFSPDVRAALLRVARREENVEVRAAAFESVSRRRRDDPELLAALGDALGEEGVTPVAERLLGRAGAPGREVLRERLLNGRSRARAAAARAAAPDLETGFALLDALQTALADREPEVQAAAARTLGRMGVRADKARAALENLKTTARDPRARRAAALALANFALPSGAQGYESPFQVLPLPEVLEVLAQEKSPALRAEAAAGLRRPFAGADAETVVKALVAALEDGERSVRLAAAGSLGVLGARAKPAVPQLLALLKSGEADALAAALGALGGIGPAAPEAVPALVEAATTPALDADAKLRALAGLALRAHGEAGAAALARALLAQDPLIRRRAAALLGQLGPLALAQTPVLLAAIHDEDDTVCARTLAAIEALGPEARPLLGRLVSLVQSPFAAQRVGAARALLAMKPEPKEADREELVNALVQGLLDPKDDAASAACQALVALGPEVLPKVRELLRAAMAEPPIWVLRVLARSKSDPDQVVPHLVRFTLPGMRPLERSAAAEHLAGYGAERPEVVPALIALFAARDEQVAQVAEQALVRLGPAAVPALAAALRAPEPRTRRHALAAWDAVTPATP